MEQSLDFKNVFLSTSDLSILASIRYGDIIDIHPESVKFLINYGFITHYALSDSDKKFVITSLGTRYLEYLDDILCEKSKAEKRFKYSEIRSWIAVAISLLALLKNFLF